MSYVSVSKLATFKCVLQGFAGARGDKGDRGESGERGRDGSQVSWLSTVI